MKFLEGIGEVILKEKVCFHMPGHASSRIYTELGYDTLLENIYKIDTTEINGTDDLHNPKGLIGDLQKRISKNYGVKESIISVNGSTAGIISSISAVVGPEDKIIVDRGCHQSVLNALIFTGSESIFIDAKIRDRGINYGVRTDEAIRLIEENKDAKAIVLTSPTYYGIVLDIKKISEVAHKYGIIVIVDEAHGAHFNFSDIMPRSSVSLGADVAIQSFHKTLPVLNQCSVIHICSDRIDVIRLRECLKIFETSSPSYMLMGSIEIGLDIAKKYGDERIKKNVRSIREVSKEAENIGFTTFIGDDGLRLFISAENFGFKGKAFEKILSEEYMINVEMSNYFGCLFLSTMANNEEDYEYLMLALANIRENADALKKKYYDKIHISSNSSELIERLIPHLKRERKLNLREAFMEESKLVKIEESVGLICAKSITPYPPGVAMVMPGEVIQKEHVVLISDYLRRGFSVYGVSDGKVSVVNR